MQKSHFIAIGAFVSLIIIIYLGANTIPPPKKQDMKPAAGAMNMAGAGSNVQAISFDSLLTAARAALTPKVAAEIAGLEKEIKGDSHSSGNVLVYKKIAHSWEIAGQAPIAAYYGAKSAKLENSEKSLNFAAQFFMDLLHNPAADPSMQMWEAREAVECYKKVLELNPANDSAKLGLAAAYIEGTKETMQGVQILLAVTREKPGHIAANLMLGRLSVQSGQFDKALARFETVLKQEPENSEALYFLAETYKGKGDKQKAIELFERCKKIVNKPQFSKDIDQYINSFK